MRSLHMSTQHLAQEEAEAVEGVLSSEEARGQRVRRSTVSDEQEGSEDESERCDGGDGEVGEVGGGEAGDGGVGAESTWGCDSAGASSGQLICCVFARARYGDEES